MIDRKQLVAALGQIAPALSVEDAIPALSCFCFDGKLVYAWDDRTALILPHDDNFPSIKGGILGRVLLDFLTHCSHKSVEFTDTGKTVLVKSGRAKMEISKIGPKEFTWEEPETKKGTTRDLTPKFLAGLSRASVAMGMEEKAGWMFGVTVLVHDNGYECFASDNRLVAYARAGKTDTDPKGYVIPPKFVEHLISISKSDAAKTITFNDKWVEAKFASGLRLFARTFAKAEPSDYRTMLAQYMKRDGEVLIPKNFERSMVKANLVFDFMVDEKKMVHLDIADNKLKVTALSEIADVRESMDIEQPDISVGVDPKQVLRVSGVAQSMSVHKACLKFSGDGFTYLVGTLVKTKKKEK